MKPVERFEAARDPTGALLGEHDAQAGMALEHATEDQVPRGAMSEPRELDQHDRPRRLVLAEVGQAAPAVHVQDDVQLLAQVPKRFVSGIPQRR